MKAHHQEGNHCVDCGAARLPSGQWIDVTGFFDPDVPWVDEDCDRAFAQIADREHSRRVGICHLCKNPFRVTPVESCAHALAPHRHVECATCSPGFAQCAAGAQRPA